MSGYIPFKKFTNPEEAGVFVELFKKNEIDYDLSADKPAEDILFAGNTMVEELQISVKEEDFDKATNLLEEIEVVNADGLDKDYYLFEFQDEELVDLLKKPDEWSLNDYHWAGEILKQRGKEVDPGTIEKWQNDRLKDLSQTETVTLKYLILAWFFCICGGFIGIFMGRHLNSYMKTLPNGQKVFAFGEKDRKKGLIISIAGAVLLVVWVVLIFTVLL
jgi:hypothetical protein